MGNRKATFEEVAWLSRELARKVMSWQPDCIISIEKGGSFTGKIIAQELNLPHYSIRVEKWYYKVPDWCRIFVRIIRTRSPWPFNKIFERLIGCLTYSISQVIKPRPMGDFNGIICPEARILLVDDEIGATGLTMKLVLDYLRQKGFQNLKTAVIHRDSSNKERLTVDYLAIPGTPTFAFPWPWRN